MNRSFTAVYKKQGKWYSGWVEEIPGVNTQGKTLDEARENLQEALEMVLEVNRAHLRKELSGRFVREPMRISFS